VTLGLEPKGTSVNAPVTQVTLLEDRAQVRRSGTVTLPPGQHTVVVKDVAPVLQDLSLRGEGSAGASLIDVRVRRALLVTTDEKPEVARALEKDIEALTEAMRVLSEDQALVQQRRQRLEAILERGLSELPEDISWGLSAPQWKETLEGLYEKLRTLSDGSVTLGQQLREKDLERTRLITQRQAFDRPDTHFSAWLEADVVVSAAGPVTLTFEYTVPNALWRPMHSARLANGTLFVESRACVWQHTGEDWVDARLVFSTARSSLGIEPPLLSDDLLAAQKKQEKLVVQARQVAIQKAAVGGRGGGGAPSTPASVELPGVDDGGETRTLEAKGPCTVPSDGRPTIVPLFDFSAPASSRHVALPELELKVFLTATATNAGRFPLLAGPVELLLQNGFVGWTKVLFVAPGETFQLSFGPDEALRVARAERDKEAESHVDTWKTTTQSVWLYLSNVGDEARTVEVKERMPVSELEQVKIELAARKCNPKPEVDANGFLTWQVELPPHSQAQVRFAYDVSTAPGVQGL
jgi:uncharacterized protein (TIGR02231 family)